MEVIKKWLKDWHKLLLSSASYTRLTCGLWESSFWITQYSNPDTLHFTAHPHFSDEAVCTGRQLKKKKVVSHLQVLLSPPLSAHDLVCIKAQRRGKYSNRLRVKKKTEDELHVMLGEDKRSKGVESEELKNKRQAAPSERAELNQQEIHCSRAENKQPDQCGRKVDVEETHFLSQSKTVVYLVHACLNSMWHPFT